MLLMIAVDILIIFTLICLIAKVVKKLWTKADVQSKLSEEEEAERTAQLVKVRANPQRAKHNKETIKKYLDDKGGN